MTVSAARANQPANQKERSNLLTHDTRHLVFEEYGEKMKLNDDRRGLRE